MAGPLCVRCGTPLDQDFGIVACMSCGAVMMIDLDGNPQLSNENSEVRSLETMARPLSSVTEEPPAENHDLEFPPQPPDPPAETFGSGWSEEPSVENPVPEWQAAPPEEGEAAINDPIEESAPLAAPEFGDPSWLDPAGEPSPGTDASAETAILTSPPPSGGGGLDFSDVTDFGNQEIEASGLLYEISITGIDHQDLRREILDVLADPRFQLNTLELATHIAKGILVLPAMNAARASLIVSRLHAQPVRVEWKQVMYGNS